MGDRAYHKYIKKIPIGGGMFRYIYDEASKVGNGIQNTASRGFNAAGHGLTQFGRGAANTAGRAWNTTSRGARNLGRKIDVGVGIGPYNRYKKSVRNLRNARSLGDRMKYAGEALAYGSQAKRSMLGRANSGLNAAGKGLTRFGKGASKNIRKGWDGATDAAGKGLNAAGRGITSTASSGVKAAGKSIDAGKKMIEGWLGFNRKKKRR